jgi:hypothetical protein
LFERNHVEEDREKRDSAQASREQLAIPRQRKEPDNERYQKDYTPDATMKRRTMAGYPSGEKAAPTNLTLDLLSLRTQAPDIDLWRSRVPSMVHGEPFPDFDVQEDQAFSNSSLAPYARTDRTYDSRGGDNDWTGPWITDPRTERKVDAKSHSANDLRLNTRANDAKLEEAAAEWNSRRQEDRLISDAVRIMKEKERAKKGKGLLRFFKKS